MKEVIGGLWFAGLIVWAILGFVPGIILIAIGCVAASCELAREQRAEAAAQSWRKQYPPYRY